MLPFLVPGLKPGANDKIISIFHPYPEGTLNELFPENFGVGMPARPRCNRLPHNSKAGEIASLF